MATLESMLKESMLNKEVEVKTNNGTKRGKLFDYNADKTAIWIQTDEDYFLIENFKEVKEVKKEIEIPTFDHVIQYYKDGRPVMWTIKMAAQAKRYAIELAKYGKTLRLARNTIWYEIEEEKGKLFKANEIRKYIKKLQGA